MASIEADSKSHSEVLGSLSKHPSLANRHMPSITSISTTSNDWGRKVHEQAMKRTIIVAWMHENYQMIAFVIIDCSYLRFSHPFRGLKVRLFFVRHNVNRARVNEIKSGIPCSVANILQRYKRIEPTTSIQSCHRVRSYFCKPILQIFYKETNASSRQVPCGEHKLRNFKARYSTTKLTIREYSCLGKFAHLNSTKL